jgi:hypothetical protein
MIVFDRCLSPRRGLSIRERREVSRGDVGCGRSDSEEEDEPLDVEGDIEWRGGLSAGSDTVIETGLGRGPVAAVGDEVLCI